MREGAQATMFDEPAYRPELQQWHTPPRLAARMCDESIDLIEGAHVLEPSAGGGALVRAALDVGAEHVTAVEIDPLWCRRLRARFAVGIDHGRVEVIEADFLAWVQTLRTARYAFDVAVTNPPFDDGRDTTFLAALVGVAPWCVALTNASALSGVERWERVWSRTHVHRVAHLVRRPQFSGAPGGSGMKDMVVTRMGPCRRAQQRVEHWPEAWS